jgi:hypothetical protein
LCTCGDKKIRWQHQKQQHNNHNFKYLYSKFANHQICILLHSSIRHIGGWDYLQYMHKSKYTQFLVSCVQIPRRSGYKGKSSIEMFILGFLTLHHIAGKLCVTLVKHVTWKYKNMLSVFVYSVVERNIHNSWWLSIIECLCDYSNTEGKEYFTSISPPVN